MNICVHNFTEHDDTHWRCKECGLILGEEQLQECGVIIFDGITFEYNKVNGEWDETQDKSEMEVCDHQWVWSQADGCKKCLHCYELQDAGNMFPSDEEKAEIEREYRMVFSEKAKITEFMNKLKNEINDLVQMFIELDLDGTEKEIFLLGLESKFYKLADEISKQPLDREIIKSIYTGFTQYILAITAELEGNEDLKNEYLSFGNGYMIRGERLWQNG